MNITRSTTTTGKHHMSGYDDFDFRAQGNQPGQPPASGAAAAAQQQGSQMPPAAEQQPAPAVPPPPRTAGGQLAPAAPPSGQPMATGIPAAQQAPVEHPPMFTPAPPPVPSAIPPIPAPSGGYQTQPAPAANQYPHHHHAGAAVQSAAEHVAAITPASQAKLTSTSGVRGALNKLGLGVGMSKREQAHAELVNRIRTPLAGNYRVAVITFKGGAGKPPPQQDWETPWPCFAQTASSSSTPIPTRPLPTSGPCLHLSACRIEMLWSTRPRSAPMVRCAASLA